MSSRIFILSGPAGVGKTTLWATLAPKLPNIQKIITTTSRQIRKGEQEGQDYYYLSQEDFLVKIKQNMFLEYALVHKNYYGSSWEELDRIITQKKTPLYIVEPQGMFHIKNLLEEKGFQITTIFLLPPSITELSSRLEKRGSETEEAFTLRLGNALGELEKQDFYDIKIVNDSFEQAAQELQDLLSQERDASI